MNLANSNIIFPYTLIHFYWTTFKGSGWNEVFLVFFRLFYHWLCFHEIYFSKSSLRLQPISCYATNSKTPNWITCLVSPLMRRVFVTHLNIGSSFPLHFAHTTPPPEDIWSTYFFCHDVSHINSSHSCHDTSFACWQTEETAAGETHIYALCRFSVPVWMHVSSLRRRTYEKVT